MSRQRPPPERTTGSTVPVMLERCLPMSNYYLMILISYL
jgi:hypothetical protein